MKIRLFFHLVFLFPISVFACSCLYSTSFCEGMTSTTNVAGVQVLKTYLFDEEGISRQYVDVLVYEELQGTTEVDTLSLLYSDGSSCSTSPNLSFFQVGDTMIVMTDHIYGASPSGFPVVNIAGWCYQNFLFTTRGAAKADYLDFKENMTDCVLMTKKFDKEELERFVTIFPVPASTEISIGSYLSLNLRATIYAADGRVIMQVNIDPLSNEPINILDWPAGVYYVRIENEQAWVTKKFVKI